MVQLIGRRSVILPGPSLCPYYPPRCLCIACDNRLEIAHMSHYGTCAAFVEWLLGSGVSDALFLPGPSLCVLAHPGYPCIFCDNAV